MNGALPEKSGITPLVEMHKPLTDLRPAEVQMLAEAVGDCIETASKKIMATVWYVAAPLLCRVKAEKLYERMGFLTFRDFWMAYFDRWGRRTILYWMQVHRNLPFLSWQQKARIPFRRLIYLAQMVQSNPKLLNPDGSATAVMLHELDRMLKASSKESERLAPLMRIYQQSEEARWSRLMMRVDTPTRYMWQELKRRMARHAGATDVSDVFALSYAIAKACDELEQDDAHAMARAIAWVQQDMLPERRQDVVRSDANDHRQH